MSEFCLWSFDDVHCYYHTACGRDVCFDEPFRISDDARFCMKCSKPIRIFEPKPVPDIDAEPGLYFSASSDDIGNVSVCLHDTRPHHPDAPERVAVPMTLTEAEQVFDQLAALLHREGRFVAKALKPPAVDEIAEKMRASGAFIPREEIEKAWTEGESAGWTNANSIPERQVKFEDSRACRVMRGIE